MITVRDRREQDLPALLEVVAAAPEAARWVDGYECVVAEAEAQAVGFLLYRLVAGEGEILNLAVAPAWRRRGVARQLWAAVQSKAELWHLEVRASNAAAIGFYQDLGFEAVGEREHYYADGETAILYTRWQT